MLDEIILYELNKLPKTAKEAINLGSMYYFNGKVCWRGHLCERYAKTGICKRCNNIKDRSDNRDWCKTRPKIDSNDPKYSEIFKNNPSWLELPTSLSEAIRNKSKFYFNRVLCKNGHLCIRRTTSPKCPECRNQEKIRNQKEKLLPSKEVVENYEELWKLPRCKKEAIEKNEKYFFTGIPCKHGHISKRFVKNSQRCFKCVENRKPESTKFNRDSVRDIVDDELFDLPETKKEAKSLNLQFYFSGIKCKNNHIDKRFVGSGKCYECAKNGWTENGKLRILTRKNLVGYDDLLKLPKSCKEAKEKNSRHYFTGIPCKHGHLDKRYTKSKLCYVCCRIKTTKNSAKKLKDPIYRLHKYLSQGIYESLKHGKQGLCWEEIVLFTPQELKDHLEKQFRDGMTMENYGWYWHLDHIKPKSLCPDDFDECWCLENLQPLLTQENLEKGNRYIGSPDNKIFVDKGNYPKKKFDLPERLKEKIKER